MKIRKQNYDLRLILGATLLFAIVLMTFDKSREFGTNFFTEITGVAITVFVINKILERKERQKRISIDQRILREIQSIIASYFSIWKHLAWKYLPGEAIENGNDFVRIYPRLVELSKLNEQFEIVSIHHPESWKLFFHNKPIKECFENYYLTLTGEIQLFINDFKMFLEPELLDALLNIMECQYFRNILMMSQEGTEKILVELEQDPDRLDAYISQDDVAHLHQFLGLMDYSQRLNTMIDKFTDVNVELYQIKKYFIHPSRFA
jgi:hypothetical protein